MKLRHSVPFLLLSTFSAGLAAVTSAKFDGGADTPYTPGQFGAAPGPTIVAGVGPDGSSALEVTLDGVNGQGNTVAFDRSIVGAQPVVPFSFDFRLGPQNASADGFSFALLPTGDPTFGTTGPANFAALDEDPDFPGVLAFGFDTWSNAGAFDTPGIGTGSDYNDISLFWNGGLVQRVDNLRPGLIIDDDVWHRASGEFNFAAGTVTLNVDAFNIFNNLAVPGLPTGGYEWRLGIGARTGGEDENAWFDNISVGVPEPTSAAMGVLALSFLARRRRH